MGLNLEGDILCLRKAHNAGIIAESRHHPGARHLLCSPHNIAFEQPVDGLLLKRVAVDIHFAILDSGLEGFVRTMFRPRLRQRLKLDIGWLAALFAEMMLDSAHLIQVQC